MKKNDYYNDADVEPIHVSPRTDKSPRNIPPLIEIVNTEKTEKKEVKKKKKHKKITSSNILRESRKNRKKEIV